MTNPTSYRTYFNSQYQEYVFEHVDWTMILSSPDGSGEYTCKDTTREGYGFLYGSIWTVV